MRRLTAATWPGRAGAGEADAAVRDRVSSILDRLRVRGAAALAELARELDGAEPRVFGRGEMQEALQRIAPGLRTALAVAAERIREYQTRAVPQGFSFADAWGNTLSLQVVPLQRVGVYVPGGRAPYPSSVLMAAVSARVAGVREVVVCTPDPSDAVLAACAVAGADRLVRLGGAQAVGAMAYGIDPVPRVDKIVGPGNRWVVEAKRQVYGQVDVEGLAGPSEVAVVADATADAEWVAADLLAQAEHGPDSLCVLFTPDGALADAVAVLCAEAKNVDIVVTASVDEAVRLADELAPEHLSLQCAGAAALAEGGRRAGAVFVGPHSPVAAGDYAAGTNHVLPTGGTARFASGLGAADFVRRVQVFAGRPEGVPAWAAAAREIASAEGFVAHERSVLMRAPAAGWAEPPRSAVAPYVPEVPPGAARLDLNENPFGWPAELWEKVMRRLRACEPNRYPRAAADLQRAVADFAGCGAESVMVGNGSDELILAVVGGLLPRVRRAILPGPTFGMYRRLAVALGLPVVPVALREDDGWSLPVEEVLEAARAAGESLCFLCRPNNPTGNLWPEAEVAALLDAGLWVVVDEAYSEFCGRTLQGWVGERPRLVLLRTLSKAFALAGLRVGYALGQPETLAPLRQVVQPWAVGVFSQAAAEVALGESGWMRDRVAAVVAERERLTGLLARVPGVAPYPSQANYVLFRLPEGRPAADVYARLAARGAVLRRWADEPALSGDKLRVTVGTPEEDDRFLSALEEVLGG